MIPPIRVAVYLQLGHMIDLQTISSKGIFFSEYSTTPTLNLRFLHAFVGSVGIQLRALAKILFLLFKLEYYINICLNAYVFG